MQSVIVYPHSKS